METEKEIVFSIDGDTCKHIYDDSLELDGEKSISRASHVEPESDGSWSVDLAPIGGIKRPERFQKRADALAFEVKLVNLYLSGMSIEEVNVARV